MKFLSIALFSLLLISSLVAVRDGDAAQPKIRIVGPIENVTFGTLINAPNGHISFEKKPHGYRLWLPGRLRIASQNVDEEGGFMFDVKDWSIDDLAQAQATFMDLGHTPFNCDPNDFSFDRNYLAPNTVVPGTGHTLLTFYDAEYHVACPSGQPLLSSIGLGISTDGGVTWTRQGQVIQGLDEARKGFAFVTQRQLNEFNNGRIPTTVRLGHPLSCAKLTAACTFIFTTPIAHRSPPGRIRFMSRARCSQRTACPATGNNGKEQDGAHLAIKLQRRRSSCPRTLQLQTFNRTSVGTRCCTAG